MEIIKPSGHGLGFFEPPYAVRDWERRNRRKWKANLHPFIFEAWHYLLSRELQSDKGTSLEEINRRIEKHIKDSLHNPAKLPQPGDADYGERKWKAPDIQRKYKRPSWLSLPAAMRFPVSTPEQWERIGRQVLPFTEVMMPLTESPVILDENTGEALETPFKQSWLAAPVENLGDLYGTRLTNMQNGEMRVWLARPDSALPPYATHQVRAKTLGAELARFLLLPESKFTDTKGSPCKPGTESVLLRKQITAGEFHLHSEKRQAGDGPEGWTWEWFQAINRWAMTQPAVSTIYGLPPNLRQKHFQ